ncbi:pyrophosphatase PpaX [Aneurinibacillus aneurinilyticus]|jgi:pyrophosphatase PpaX|uniref:Pyrophosphatase PpaX n=2 Tax=Aneurinibacillus aneurinilyticus TaxID=1391 RepID=A0A848D1E9_ANEAE|nr:pyrophosphatase PpaX [Aneurinibacillus aneurinilyticus]ERI04495.1 HAD hydrolase, family IA, variant 3 [Aneurinibacillus aneurinilyticus ATCC 12856]MED0670757.1 pyrophosphatase PpaX [Aneurinibacillus aneurinilyticus]MED0706497.1 pyrophosphatase PpaX [Aneurinibacillus aneurinilyticus]MED0721420.1 pyrophosphatase PpaX [Aneurinibacillus aneurinilyticus]MED0731146.1 pyrophosphatase PpaX [Aneurinibacillus aneurinilyticus]
MYRYQYVLFDLDGTLIDTNNLILTSFMYTLEKFYPGKYTREDLIPHMGKPLYDQMELFGPERSEELVQVYREHNERVHDELVEEFPNVLDTIEQLAKMGIKMGIVTTKQRKTAEMGLRLFGLDKYMDTFISYQDTEKHKPHPEPVHKAMQALGADPARTLMVGDSQYDIQAGQNAGIASAGVAWSLKGASFLSSFNPTYLLNDMSDIIQIVKQPTRQL